MAVSFTMILLNMIGLCNVSVIYFSGEPKLSDLETLSRFAYVMHMFVYVCRYFPLIGNCFVPVVKSKSGNFALVFFMLICSYLLHLYNVRDIFYIFCVSVVICFFVGFKGLFCWHFLKMFFVSLEQSHRGVLCVFVMFFNPFFFICL